MMVILNLSRKEDGKHAGAKCPRDSRVVRHGSPRKVPVGAAQRGNERPQVEGETEPADRHFDPYGRPALIDVQHKAVGLL